MVLARNGVKPMKKIYSDAVEEERTYRKLKLDLEVLPANHGSRGRKMQELATVKAKMTARRT